MSEQNNPFQLLMEERMKVLDNLSQENAKYLRLLQLVSGNDILLMKDPSSEAANASQNDSDEALKKSRERLARLEKEMAEIDEKIRHLADQEDGS